MHQDHFSTTPREASTYSAHARFMHFGLDKEVHAGDNTTPALCTPENGAIPACTPHFLTHVEASRKDIQAKAVRRTNATILDDRRHLQLSTPIIISGFRIALLAVVLTDLAENMRSSMWL